MKEQQAQAKRSHQRKEEEATRNRFMGGFCVENTNETRTFRSPFKPPSSPPSPPSSPPSSPRLEKFQKPHKEPNLGAIKSYIKVIVQSTHI